MRRLWRIFGRRTKVKRAPSSPHLNVSARLAPVIRTATRDDLPFLCELFARGNDTPYDLAVVAEEKCFEGGFAGEPVVRVIEGKAAAVTCGKFLRLLAVDRDARGKGFGSALLRDSQASVIAAEPGNYFIPGVLESQRGFFEKHGFVESASTWNLDASTDIEGEALRPAHADRDRVLAYVEREFGRIWRLKRRRRSSARSLRRSSPRTAKRSPVSPSTTSTTAASGGSVRPAYRSRCEAAASAAPSSAPPWPTCAASATPARSSPGPTHSSSTANAAGRRVGSCFTR